MRKVYSLILCAVMIVCLLAGCSGQDPETTQAPVGASSSGEATQAPASEEATTGTAPATEESTQETTTESSATEATTEAPTEPEAPVPEEGTAARAYWEAMQALPADYSLSLNWELSRSMGKELLIVTDSRLIQVQNGGSENMVAHENWDRTIEGNRFRDAYSYQFWFKNEEVLLSRNGEYFKGEESAQDFLTLRPPLAMMSLDNYDLVEWEAESARVIRFSEANDTEWEWLGMDCSDITDAWGSVELDEKGHILRTVYEAVFALEGIEFTVHVTAELKELKEDIKLPQTGSAKMTPLGKTGAVPLMDLALTFLRTDGMTADYLAFVQSYAKGAVVLQQSWTGLDENENGSMVYHKSSRGTYGMTNEFFDSEYRHFNGKTSYLEDDEEVEMDLSPEEVGENLLLFLESYWMGPEDIIVNQLLKEEDCWLIEFSASSKGREKVYYNTEILMGEDEESASTSSYSSNVCEGCLSIDKSSGLPIHLFIHLEGGQRMPGQIVPVYADYELNFMGANPDAASTITGDIDKGAKPEVPATPLFYKISAPKGGSMWLLGTIHVGDNRSSWLPQEIYDALLSADALAVEIDTSKFEERLEEDESMMEAYQKATYYLDGTSVYDHVSEEQAEKLELAIKKYGGNILVDSLAYNVATISSYLEQMIQPLGRMQTYERGVDNQLVDLAQKNDIPVWDVEDYAEHITLMGNFSEKLQAMIMEETVDASRYSKNLGAGELFDLWCRGDEEEIQTFFEEEEEEDKDLTEEEQAMVDEYNYAMMEKRNAEMVEKAREYMDSDQVVFFAVGLAHLMGEDGLLNCLRQAGYTVEQVAFLAGVE